MNFDCLNKSRRLLFFKVINKMKSVTIIFPHQLYQPHPSAVKDQPVILVEEWLYFRQYSFHKKKLMLHRASMKKYADYLASKKIAFEYIEATSDLCDIRKLIPSLAAKGLASIHYTDTTDDWLNRRIEKSCKQQNIQKTVAATPNFVNSMEEVNAFFNQKKKYFQTAFYIDQRKKRKILIDAAEQPIGGQWSFDADNRQRYPKTKQAPAIKFPKEDNYIKEARAYVNKHFGDNYGATENFIYPTDQQQAAKWLNDFLENRLLEFGVYEDALVSKAHFLHHSVLTPMLNTGLLQPKMIVEKALQTAAKKNTPINSLEGFVRQIIGWREFIRIVYEREGHKQRTTNFWGFSRKIPKSFWTGNTGIVPVDNVIKKLLQTGYSHHIERLMVMGNFMLLCEFDPDEVYRWFMEMYIDAYDWVMVPNVYGMTQFADGGLMMTKPYISSSNYLMKMGDYPKGNWTAIWDGLFWRFMHVNREVLSKNQRLGMLIKTFDKMNAAKQKEHLNNAANFLASLDNEKNSY